MSSDPQISFIIPVYNMADTLPDTLQSLLLIQDFPLEIIVINDGSTDATEKVIREWQCKSEKHSNISFYTLHQANGGRADALNKGVEIARAEYISFVDADDLIDSDELLKLKKFMNSSSWDLIIGQFRIETETGRDLGKRVIKKNLKKKDLILKLAFSPISPIHLNAILIKKKHFLKLGGFDPDHVKSQDKDFVFRLLKSDAKYTICDSFHYVYRKHELGRIELIKKRYEWFIYRQKMIRKNFTGSRKYGSMGLQALYDFVKLIYEGLFKYRL